jgi:hypothetical protein
MMSAEQTTQIILPDVLRQDNTLPFGKITVYVEGTSGWMATPQGRTPLPPPQLQQTQSALFRLREALLLSDGDVSRQVNFIEQAEADGKAADVIEISKGGQFVRLWVDSASGDILKSAYKGDALRGAPADIEEIYSDYREVDGLRTPFAITILQNGEKYLDGQVVEVKFNSGLTRERLGAE